MPQGVSQLDLTGAVDPELEQIRAERLAQLQQSGGKFVQIVGGGAAVAPEDEDDEYAAEDAMLTRMLEPSARARLNTIAVSRPDRVERVKDILHRMARQGQLRGKMNEGTLLKLVEEVNRQYEPPPKATLTFQRGKGTRDNYNSDDDEDDD